ncbi:MAG: amidohydrolase family protein [Gammaproteobacteria bacterium]|nr:amidohydrolase family protein [Gammaproteobacteria bacterium]
MPHDLVIRGGNIVDGTGAEPFTGDVAVDGATISKVGKVDDRGAKEVDAEGHAVTPGFVDLHTHFDAQAGWDPLLTPVSWHGVTTALFGNCGVTFAPCKPADREFLAGMMETVEDIPKDAILGGLPWDWESYGQYLDSIEKLNPAINITGLVGHCASRFYVMGERAITDDATEDEIRQIAALVGQSVKEGAIGFSTNRLPGHVLPDGRSIPGTFAQPEELVAISEQVGKHGGILQSVLNYGKLDDEMAILTKQGRAGRTRMLFSAPYNPGTDGQGTGYDAAIASMKAEGIDISGLTLPRSGGFLSGLKTDILFAPGAGLRPRGTTAWGSLVKLDFEARLAAIQDADTRAKLVEEAKADPTIEERAANYFWLGDEDRPQYVKPAEQSLKSLAKAAGKHPVEIWLDKMLETDGQAMFHVRFFNTDLEALPGFLKADWVLPGIGDAGAHVSQIMDSGWTSFLLSHWVREKGEFSIQEAVRRMTSASARVLGFTDRGALREGMKADINVIDMTRVRERQPKLVHDFPGGAPRLIQKAVGYKATVCNGTVILADDEHTGERAGLVLRNPSMA